MISQEQYENFVSFLEQSKVNGNVAKIRDNEINLRNTMPCFYFPDMYTYAIAYKIGDKIGARICFDMYRYDDNAIFLYKDGALVGYLMRYPDWLKW